MLYNTLFNMLHSIFKLYWGWLKWGGLTSDIVCHMIYLVYWGVLKCKSKFEYDLFRTKFLHSTSNCNESRRPNVETHARQWTLCATLYSTKNQYFVERKYAEQFVLQISLQSWTMKNWILYNTNCTLMHSQYSCQKCWGKIL